VDFATDSTLGGSGGVGEIVERGKFDFPIGGFMRPRKNGREGKKNTNYELRITNWAGARFMRRAKVEAASRRFG
jgi:hypothetical protein